MAAGRLAATFAALRQRGERALVPYVTAGDPSLAITRRLVVEVARRGADIVELGVPFSDPLADGPVIQRATQRALHAGVTLPRVLELARELRGETAVPLVFLTYYNPILAFGLKAFCGRPWRAAWTASSSRTCRPRSPCRCAPRRTPGGST